MTTTLTQLQTFNGDFDSLPIKAHILLGQVPLNPNYGDFCLAVSDLEHDQTPESLWRLEAIRWRLANQGKNLDLQAINKVVAKRLYEEATA